MFPLPGPVPTAATPRLSLAIGGTGVVRFKPMAEKGKKTKDISGTTAPSIGPDTVISTEPPEERLARHEQSDIDAMGRDKRREVVGQSYGPSFARQAILYLSVLAVLVLVFVGLLMLVGQFDQAPETIEAQAPWAQQGAEQTPVGPTE